MSTYSYVTNSQFMESTTCYLSSTTTYYTIPVESPLHGLFEPIIWNTTGGNGRKCRSMN